MAEFRLKYGQACAECEERIRAGFMGRYNDEGKVVHVTCPAERMDIYSPVPPTERERNLRHLQAARRALPDDKRH